MSTIYGKGIYMMVAPSVPEASLTPQTGITYTDGLPNDWNTMKEIAKAISEASGSINANTTGAIYVNKENRGGLQNYPWQYNNC